MKVLIDQLGRKHSFTSSPQRIISLVPSQTELLYDLGLENKIIGITKFCTHPHHLKQTKTIVGGTKKVHFKKIKALNPEVIICNKEENTKDIVEILSEICPVWVTDILTIKDNFQMITDFGQLFNKRTEAQKWNDKLTFALNDFRFFIKNKPTHKVGYFIWKNPYMVTGSNNYINELLKLNHFKNIYDSMTRYPEVLLHKIEELQPDLLLLSSEPYPFKKEDVYQIQPFTKAQIILVDGEMFSWYGTRLLKAFNYFKIIHNNLENKHVVKQSN